ncbi:hypothetical protein BY458DRAFT_506294 [Sporodiniella umbellata]|nr:hypothetical protein BY458DRAFT_506294 [Sporodiniella umbellata]
MYKFVIVLITLPFIFAAPQVKVNYETCVAILLQDSYNIKCIIPGKDIRECQNAIMEFKTGKIYQALDKTSGCEGNWYIADSGDPKLFKDSCGRSITQITYIPTGPCENSTNVPS